MDEIWKPIDGHPRYEVSNLGRVRSLGRMVFNKGMLVFAVHALLERF